MKFFPLTEIDFKSFLPILFKEESLALRWIKEAEPASINLCEKLKRDWSRPRTFVYGCCEDNGMPAGVVLLMMQTPPSRFAMLEIFTCAERCASLVAGLTSFLSRELNLTACQVRLHPFENVKILAFEKCGWELQAHLREEWIDVSGSCFDELRYGFIFE